MTIGSANNKRTSNKSRFLGLAPLLRSSIAGRDLRPVAQELFVQAGEYPDDPATLMNLSLALQCVGQRDLGLAIQDQALSIERVFRLEATDRPVRLRLLMLMVPGDLADNTPLECLLETGDIELIFYYLTPGNPFAAPIPEHDVVLVSMAESVEHRKLLEELQHKLARWPKPVVNAAEHILKTNRQVVSQLLQDAPGVFIPPTLPASRVQLLKVAQGERNLSDEFPGCEFPVIVRPTGSQAGRDLDRMESPEELEQYLAKVIEPDFFLSHFIDYRSADGFYRKSRIAMIDGVPWPCHQGISLHWMVHYVNAGMYDDPWKRLQESEFMATFDDFATRHQTALAAIYERIPLDYFCIDCAETADFQLLVFELDHCMVVHAMDSEKTFPYKLAPMQKVKAAVRDALLRRQRGT